MYYHNYYDDIFTSKIKTNEFALQNLDQICDWKTNIVAKRTRVFNRMK